jgi:predicted GH43/DUF377 family glycosyl hydrolase
VADPDRFPEEVWGIEDPRITHLPELGKYVILYTAYSHVGPGVALALTEDFHDFERYGMIMPPADKDAALFPRRIGGQWALIHRPVSAPGAHMWMSYSPDLRHWGSHKLMMEARHGGWWDANKQDRPLAAAHRNCAGLVGDLPRRAPDRGRRDIPAGTRAV